MIWALHGAVGMAEDWAPFPVQGIDLWQFLEDGECSLAEAGERIAALAQDGDTLIGYSMGGRLALHTLGHRCWKKVILVSAHPGLESGQAERLATDQEWAKKAEGDWDEFLREWNGQAILPPVRWGDREKLAARRKEIARSFRAWSLGRQQRFTDFPPSVSWVVGENDAKFRALAPAHATVIPGVGHRAPWENPEAFSKFIQSSAL